jgi:hypothetical protein
MEHLYQASGAHGDLLTDPAHGYAVQVVHNHPGRNQLVSIKTPGKHPRGTGGEELLTSGTILLGKAVEEAARLERLTVDDQALLDPFVFQAPPTMGTQGIQLRRHPYHLVGFGFGKPFAASPPVPRFGPLGFALPRLIALDGDFRRRSRGTEKSLLRFALLIAEFLPQAFIFFQKLIDFTLLFKAAWTIASPGHQDRFLLGEDPLWFSRRRIERPRASRFPWLISTIVSHN